MIQPFCLRDMVVRFLLITKKIIFALKVCLRPKQPWPLTELNITTYVCNHRRSLKTKMLLCMYWLINPYPTAFPYGNGMVLHFYQQQESITTKTVHKVINKGFKTYV